jgi:general L-amino acid transport system ATP-binding protein
MRRRARIGCNDPGHPLHGFRQDRGKSVYFMEFGEIGEENEPHAFFDNPQQEKTRLFLSRIL